jgi:hypothetical protein
MIFITHDLIGSDSISRRTGKRHVNEQEFPYATRLDIYIVSILVYQNRNSSTLECEECGVKRPSVTAFEAVGSEYPGYDCLELIDIVDANVFFRSEGGS